MTCALLSCVIGSRSKGVTIMALYLISFDLSDPLTKDYEPLWDFLGGSGARQILHGL